MCILMIMNFNPLMEVFMSTIPALTLTSVWSHDPFITTDGWFCEISNVGSLVESAFLYNVTLFGHGLVAYVVHAIVTLICTPLLLVHLRSTTRVRRYDWRAKQITD